MINLDTLEEEVNSNSYMDGTADGKSTMYVSPNEVLALIDEARASRKVIETGLAWIQADAKLQPSMPPDICECNHNHGVHTHGGGAYCSACYTQPNGCQKFRDKYAPERGRVVGICQAIVDEQVSTKKAHRAALAELEANQKGRPEENRHPVEWDDQQLDGKRDARLLHLDVDGVFRGPGNSLDQDWAKKILEAKRRIK